ncbi:hypothetical protein GIB67_019968, partial [Kingdonia uniflora]
MGSIICTSRPTSEIYQFSNRSSSEDHLLHEDLTRPVRMVWTVLKVVKMMNLCVYDCCM